MKKISDYIVNHAKLILIIGIILLIPAGIGYVKTRINYDILVYLPDTVDTIKGENILTDDFHLGSYAFVMIDNETNRNILKLEEKIKEIKGVNKVISVADLLDSGIPSNMLPDEIRDKVAKDDSTIIMVTFDGSTSEDGTIKAVRDLRKVVNKNNISSMTAMVVDTMDLSNQEILIYVVIAVGLCLIALTFSTDSYVIPIFLLMNIGIAIIYNLGSNIFLGQISYITKAITAILQLGVTTDFSIFLYHKYEQEKQNEKDKKKAMSMAIRSTFTSVLGSSLTTFAGFLALCTMSLTLGNDIGIVMAKGVLCGLITVLTIFPAMLLIFDKLIEKTKHKNYFPQFMFVQNFATKHRILILIVFVILMVPAFIGYKNYDVYYKLDDSLPKELAFNKADEKLRKDYNIVSPQVILINKDLNKGKIEEIVDKLEKVEGIDMVLSPAEIFDDGIMSVMPDELVQIMDNEKYSLIIVNSSYEIASDELNKQLDTVNNIVKEYDKKAIVAGEGALMKDLVTIADHDFKAVNYTSLIVIFCIMLFVLKSVSLPIILIIAIEFAIFMNMSFAYFTNTSLPFIASIVVGTIQLGATIDYAILMSTKYLEERKKITSPKEAMKETLKYTTPSIITSALCFFCATIGVGLYTKIDMIGSICNLLARGSIISMLVVLLILPSLLMTFDKIIMKTTKNK